MTENLDNNYINESHNKGENEENEICVVCIIRDLITLKKLRCCGQLLCTVCLNNIINISHII